MRALRRFRFLFLAVCAVAVLASEPVPGAILFQTDSFQDGTTQGWTSGGPNPVPPRVVVDSGPLGLGDVALEVRATGGFGAGSKLLAFNQSQWAGNYTAAGIAAIRADVFNPGAFDLVVRLGVTGAGGQFSSLVGAAIPAGSGWQSITLPIGPAALTSVGGSDLNRTLGSVTELRILHNPVPDWEGASVAGNVFLDNITAVPEPGPALLLVTALVGLSLFRRR